MSRLSSVRLMAARHGPRTDPNTSRDTAVRQPNDRTRRHGTGEDQTARERGPDGTRRHGREAERGRTGHGYRTGSEHGTSYRLGNKIRRHFYSFHIATTINTRL